jgi:hypothetical protein
MHSFKRGIGTIIGAVLLVIETVRILSELGVVRAASGALNLWNVYEFMRDHVWKSPWLATVLDVFSHPLMHVFLLASGVGLIIWDNRRTKPQTELAAAPTPAAPVEAQNSKTQSQLNRPRERSPLVPANRFLSTAEKEKIVDTMNSIQDGFNDIGRKIAREAEKISDALGHQRRTR